MGNTGGKVSINKRQCARLRRASLVIAAVAAVFPASAMARSPDVPLEQHDYHFPAISLTDQHGHAVALDRVMTADRAAVVEFFFTACTTICGVRSAQIAAALPILGRDGVNVDFYTVSIDPDHDTPPRLLEYARQFGPPSPNWHLLTGPAASVRAVQAAFHAEDPSGDKMMHAPLTFVCAGKGQPWLRIEGILSTRQLVERIERQVAQAR